MRYKNNTNIGYKTKSKNLVRISKLLVVVLIVIAIQPGTRIAQAANITSLSDNLTRLAANTLADHEIKFITPTGIAATKTVTFTFGAGFSLGTFAVANEDFATGVGSNCSTATYTEQTLAATASGTTWGGLLKQVRQ